MQKVSIKEALANATRRLNDSADTDPRRTASLLLSHLTQKPIEKIIIQSDETLSESLLKSYYKLIERRTRGEPLQYILGEWEFYKRKFFLNPDVFIPRPETEFIIDAAKKYIDKEESLKVLDIGAGSGAIAITLAAEFAYSSVTAVEMSEPALKIALKNALSIGVADRVKFIASDSISALNPGCKFDLVVTNPPYVPEAEYGGLQKEIVCWEPIIAFLGGSDGLNFLRLLTEGGSLKNILHPPIDKFLGDKGLFITEIGWNQRDAVLKLMNRNNRLKNIDVIEDYNGIPRTLVFRKK